MPTYDHHLFLCINERGVDDAKSSCARKGSLALLDHARQRCFAAGLKERVRVNGTGCLKACALGPSAVVYGAHNPPQGVWHTLADTAAVDALIDALIDAVIDERSGGDDA